MHDSGKRQSFETGAVRDTADEKPRPDLCSPFAEERAGEWMRKGAAKYSERNWEKGMPLSRFVASLCRHLMKLRQGDASEDHAAAIRFNADGFMHGQEMIRRGVWPVEFDDMPNYGKPIVSNARALAEERSESGGKAMIYRILGKDEKPDKAKGDQYCTPGRRRDIWQATSLRGHRTVAECNRAGNPCMYRRPANKAISESDSKQ